VFPFLTLHSAQRLLSSGRPIRIRFVDNSGNCWR